MLNNWQLLLMAMNLYSLENTTDASSLRPRASLKYQFCFQFVISWFSDPGNQCATHILFELGSSYN